MTEPQFPVSQPVMTAAKSVAATLAAAGTFVGLVVNAFADGTVTTTEVGSLVTGGIGAVVSVLAVWATRNKVKKG